MLSGACASSPARSSRSGPGAAASVREGLAETVTITRFGISSQRALGRTLATTNPIESMLSVCRERARNVKRWRSGEMACAGRLPACSTPSAASDV
jgi:hypothetical protein